MKFLQLGCLFIGLFFSLSGCQQDTPSNHINGFVEPEPTDWVKYSKPVREYMYYRTQAVIENNIHILWDRYPELKENFDLTKGINIEKQEIHSLNQGFELLDANYDIESYERIKVKAINDHEVIVLVHGSIGYLRSDFEESGGEYLIELFLNQKDNKWTIVKTDEYTLPEYKEWIQGKN